MIYKNNILFIHIPRTGGTSLQDYASKTVGFSLREMNSKGKHITLSKFYEEFSYIPEKIITLIRNPYERLVSIYYFLLRIHNDNLYGEKNDVNVLHAVNSGSFKNWLKTVGHESKGKSNYDFFAPSYFHYLNIEGVVPNHIKYYFTDELDVKKDEIIKLFGGTPEGLMKRRVVTPHPHYSKCYDKECYEIASKLCSWSLNKWKNKWYVI